MSGYIGTKASVVTPGAERKKVFSITTTTTSLTGLVYTPGFVHVFHNGVRLVDGTDYTATNGTSITLTTAAQNGDEVVVISYATFQTSDTVSASAGGTFNNDVAINGDLTVDTNTLFVDAANNRVGIGATTLDAPLTIKNPSVSGDQNILTVQNGAGTNAVAKVVYNQSDDSMKIINASTFAGSYMGFWTSNTERARIDASGHLIVPAGVTLGTSAGVYNAVNTLDDYEEGTWTPTGSASATVNSVVVNGAYVKIGSLVHAYAYFAVTTTNTAFIIGGLPFSGLGYGPATIYYNSPASFAGNAYIEAGTNFMYFSLSTTLSNFGVMISATYRAL